MNYSFDMASKLEKLDKKTKLSTITESIFLKMVLEAFKDDPDIILWRNNVGAIHKEYKGKQSYIAFGIKGSSDILGIAKRPTCPKCNNVTGIGTLISIECKTNKGRVSPEQSQWIGKINKMGGIAFVLRPGTDNDLFRIRERILEKINDLCTNCFNQNN